MSTSAISQPTFSLPPSAPGTPSWPITLLYPLQGQWSEEEYLSLQEKTRRIVELSDGQIEVLPNFAVDVAAVFEAGQTGGAR